MKCPDCGWLFPKGLRAIPTDNQMKQGLAPWSPLLISCGGCGGWYSFALNESGSWHPDYGASSSEGKIAGEGKG
jgi:hypothetical protein